MFSHVFKDTEASKKAWLKRTRAIAHGGKEVGWLDENGEPVTGRVMDALKAMKKAIPPGWTDVRIATDPKAEVLVSGIDSKGRTQQIYSAAHTAASAAVKFARVEALNEKISGLVDAASATMLDSSLSSRARDAAATIYLVSKTGFRPGSTRDTGAEEQAYGASTLERRHITINQDTIGFEFVGKKGVRITKTLKDKPLSEYLDAKVKNLAPSEKVFTSSGAQAMEFLKKNAGAEFKIKDLRTWNGTALARYMISKEEPPKTEEDIAAMKKRVSTAVSEHLGNTPTIALNSYINPTVWPNVSKRTKIKKKD